MDYLTKSLPSLVLLLVAAFLYAVGTAFLVGFYASVFVVSASVSISFWNAADWLLVAAATAALAAVAESGWRLVQKEDWDSAWELGAGTVGVLLLWIGLLVNAIVSQPGLPSQSGQVLGAVGIAVWALLALSRAARRSLAEQQAQEHQQPFRHRARLWLVAAGGLTLLAAGYGFVPDVSSQGTGIAAGILQALGIAAVLTAVALASPVARLPREWFSREQLLSRAGVSRILSRAGLSRPLELVLAGLAVLVAAFIAYAVMAGLVFGSNLSLTGVRVGPSVVIGIQFVAVVVLGMAVWTRLRELTVPPARQDGQLAGS